MKRDLDLIRNILLAIEEDETGKLDLYELADTLHVAPEQLYYHLELLRDAKFIIVHGGVVPFTPTTRKHDPYKISRMTFAGCDYLDSIKSDTVWNQVKNRLKHVGGAASFEVVKELAVRTTLQILQPRF